MKLLNIANTENQGKPKKLTGSIIFLLLGVLAFTMILSLPASAGEVEMDKMVTLNQEDNDQGIQALGIKTEKINDSKMVGLRHLGNKFNWGFGFNSENKTVLIYGAEKEGELNIEKALYNGQEIASKPIIREGRTYISFGLLKKLLVDLEDIEVGLLATLSPAKTVVKRGEKIKAVIELYNISDRKIRINYPSGQLYDLYLAHKKAEIWRWSDGKFFTMALSYKDLKPGNKLRYQEKIPFAEDYETGDYILSGKIATRTAIPLPEIEIKVK